MTVSKLEALEGLERVALTINSIRKSLKPVSNFEDCTRCCGKGGINAFSHVKGGICFSCNGSKKRPSNKNAKDFRAIFRCFKALKRSLHEGITELRNHTNSKELAKIIDSLAVKHTAGVTGQEMLMMFPVRK